VEVRPCLERLWHSEEDIGAMTAEAYEVVEVDGLAVQEALGRWLAEEI
jgi:hypothetical protein